MSRPQVPSSSTTSESPPKVHSSTPEVSGGDGAGTGTGSEQGQSSASPQPRYSETSDGYPSWLPKRPPPPAPGSTFHSSAPSEPVLVQGRKPTPRSVRIISMQDSNQGERREPTDQTRVSSGNPLHQRVWSRATGAGMSPTVFGSINGAQVPRPRFRSSALHLELLRSPSPWMRFQFYLLPFFVFAHIPLQTFFDFNAVFILLE